MSDPHCISFPVDQSGDLSNARGASPQVSEKFYPVKTSNDRVPQKIAFKSKGEFVVSFSEFTNISKNKM